MNEKTQLKDIPAKCHNCGWEGKLLKCLSELSAVGKFLSSSKFPEINPTCPKCNKIVSW